jgi:hypothetical protein
VQRVGCGSSGRSESQRAAASSPRVAAGPCKTGLIGSAVSSSRKRSGISVQGRRCHSLIAWRPSLSSSKL